VFIAAEVLLLGSSILEKIFEVSKLHYLSHFGIQCQVPTVSGPTGGRWKNSLGGGKLDKILT
jgi:hypothetical protein